MKLDNTYLSKDSIRLKEKLIALDNMGITHKFYRNADGSVNKEISNRVNSLYNGFGIDSYIITILKDDLGYYLWYEKPLYNMKEFQLTNNINKRIKIIELCI